MFVVYGTKTCGFCKKAVILLQEKSKPFSYHPLEDRPELREHLIEKFSWKTVPIVIKVDIDKPTEEMLIGGFTDLVKHINEIENEIQTE